MQGERKFRSANRKKWRWMELSGPHQGQPTCGVGRPHSGPPCPHLSRAGRVEFVLPVRDVHLPHTCFFCDYNFSRDKVCTKGTLPVWIPGSSTIIHSNLNKALITNLEGKCWKSKCALSLRVTLTLGRVLSLLQACNLGAQAAAESFKVIPNRLEL